MAIEIEFGSQGAARQIRKDPQYKGFLHESDDGRETTVRLKENTPEPALDDITGKAADSKQHRAEKAGQAPLSRREREEIDFSRPGVNVPKVRSIKAIADNVGVSDYLSFADLELTVDENREILKAAAREERGKRGLGRDKDSAEMTDKRLAQAHAQKQRGKMDRAKQFALVETDSEAQEFVTQNANIDIFFNRRGNRIVGGGEDFDRLSERHENRSQRAQTVDAKRSAKKTRNPIQWANNPAKYDFPGIDTIQPHKLHEQRSEQAQEADEDELAPLAETKEQWANNPDVYDWPGVDTPPAFSPDMGFEEAANAEFALNMSTGDDSPMDEFTDERDRQGTLDVADPTQHRESKLAEEQATQFGVDDRDSADRGTENESDSGEQRGFEEFGGGVRENETLF